MNSHGIIDFTVLHRRLWPKKYQFKHHFFWFKINLDNVEKINSPFVSYNRPNLYSFYDKDHIKLGEMSARENYISFAKKSGLDKKIKNVTIFTQLRFLGYVFNPVSFIFLNDEDNQLHAIIEIGNTFNELKPYFVPHDVFTEQGFEFKTKKMFYISPFIDHDNFMTFKLRQRPGGMDITIIDEKDDQRVLEVFFNGKHRSLSSWELVKQTIFSPFITLQFITFIHLHAFMLWLKGLKFFKKSEHSDLQQGTFIWKT